MVARGQESNNARSVELGANPLPSTYEENVESSVRWGNGAIVEQQLWMLRGASKLLAERD